MSQDRRFYVVRGQAAHGVITHRCPTVEFALDSLKRFTREKMQGVRVLDPNGDALSPAELERLADERGAPKSRVSAEPA